MTAVCHSLASGASLLLRLTTWFACKRRQWAAAHLLPWLLLAEAGQAAVAALEALAAGGLPALDATLKLRCICAEVFVTA